MRFYLNIIIIIIPNKVGYLILIQPQYNMKYNSREDYVSQTITTSYILNVCPLGTVSTSDWGRFIIDLRNIDSLNLNSGDIFNMSLPLNYYTLLLSDSNFSTIKILFGLEK